MKEQHFIIPLPLSLEKTGLPDVYSTYLTDPAEQLVRDLEDLINMKTAEEICKLLTAFSAMIAYEQACLPIPSSEQSAQLRLICAVRYSHNPKDLQWLRGYISGFINRYSQYSGEDLIHLAVLAPETGGTFLVKTSCVDTIVGFHRDRLARIRLQFSPSMRAAIRDRRS